MKSKKRKQSDEKLKEFYKKYPHLMDEHPSNKEGIIASLFYVSEKTLIIIMCIAFILIGLININSTMGFAYYAGLIFFLAGYFTGTNDKSTLLFLYSHGVVGIIFMVASTFGTELYQTPLLQDGFTAVHAYYILSILILIVATVISTIRSIKLEFRWKKYSLLIPLVIYFIGMFMLELLPKIYMFIYKL